MTTVDTGDQRDHGKRDNASANRHFQAPGLIVGIGASAGGTEALREFFSAVPRHPNMAFIVVQHLSPANPHLLPELLRAQTSLPIYEVLARTELVEDAVFVIAPDTILTLDGGYLEPRPQEGPADRHTAIDRLFGSIAENVGSKSAGVILSGTGNDGTAGLLAINEAGGIAIAQDLHSAKFESMPESASAAGVVDQLLLPQEMYPRLARFARSKAPQSKNDADTAHAAIIARLPDVCEAMKDKVGHDFKHYKDSTLVRRIVRRMQVTGIIEIEDYLASLRSDSGEASLLFKDLLIGVTEFFRDPEAFSYVEKHVLPEIFKDRRGDNPVRFWVAGTSSGEEAYSFAILLREQMDKMADPPQVQIFATDLDTRALDRARQGVFPESIAEHVTPNRLARFFRHEGKVYRASKEIRDLCLFSAHNLIADPPFLRMDLISCRNVLIYLGEHLQKKLIPLFHYALKPNGFLFLGPAENLSSHRELFQPLEPRLRISRRLPTAVPGPAEIPVSSKAARASYPAEDPDLHQIAQRIVLDEFCPSYMLVGEQLNIVSLSKRIERYLEPAAGRFENYVFRLLAEGLRTAARSALAEAERLKRTVVNTLGTYRQGDALIRVRLTVQPMPELGQLTPLYMLVFQDWGSVAGDQSKAGVPFSDQAQVIAQLERDLQETRRDLERTVQELESSNEELKSSNEELISMNEELQSSNEELEVSKEEVQAANAALERANSDLENLLASTRIATIFLDDHGKILSYTPAAADIYCLIERDIGRPLGHLNHRATRMPRLPSPEQVAKIEVITDEFQTDDGRWFVRRALPYRTREGETRGVVLTFADITALRQSERRYRCLADATAAIVWTRDPNGGFTTEQPTWAKYTGQIFSEYQGRGWLAAFQSEDRASIEATWNAAVKKKKPYKLTARLWHQELATYRYVESRGVPVTDSDGDVTEWVGMIVDVHERVVASENLRLEQERVRLLLDSTAEGIYGVDLAGHCIFCNAAAARLLGFRSPEEVLGKNMHALVHQPGTQEGPSHCAICSATLELKGDPIKRAVLWRVGGQPLPVDYWSHPIQQKDTVYGAVVTFLDASERERSEAEVRQKSEILAALGRISETLAGELSLEKIVDHVLKESTRLSGAEFGAFFYNLLDSKGESYTLYATFGVPKESFSKFLMPRKTAVFEPTFAGKGNVRLDDVTKDPRYGKNPPYNGMPKGHLPVRSYLAVPVVSRSGEVLGGLFFGHSLPAVFDQAAEDLVTNIASQAAVAIDNARLFEAAQSEIKERKAAEERLQAAKEAADAANVSKSTFLANMSHEIRSPMTAILGHADLLAAQLSGADQLQTVQTITRNGLYLLEIINDILDLSRIEAGKLNISSEAFDVDAVFVDVLAMMKSRAEEKGVKLSLSIDRSVPRKLQTDRVRLRQILINLIGNAVKFTRSGEVKVTVKAPPATAKSLSGAASLLEVGVIDTGIGMSDAQIKALFQPFSQGDSSITREFGGTGLGLTITKRLVEMLGGEISVESAEGKGSDFKFRIRVQPVSGEERSQPSLLTDFATSPRLPEKIKLPRLDGCSVLLVDDSPDIGTFAKRVLEAAGAKVVGAANGQVALAIVDAGAVFDVIITDMQMPLLDGYETTRQLRQRGVKTPIVAMTAGAMIGDKERCLAAGCSDYLPKPVRPRSLVVMVDKWRNQ